MHTRTHTHKYTNFYVLIYPCVHLSIYTHTHVCSPHVSSRRLSRRHPGRAGISQYPHQQKQMVETSKIPKEAHTITVTFDTLSCSFAQAARIADRATCVLLSAHTQQSPLTIKADVARVIDTLSVGFSATRDPSRRSSTLGADTVFLCHPSLAFLSFLCVFLHFSFLFSTSFSSRQKQMKTRESILSNKTIKSRTSINFQNTKTNHNNKSGKIKRPPGENKHELEGENNQQRGGGFHVLPRD